MLLYPANAALQLAFKQISSTCIFHAGSSTFPPSYAWSMIRSFVSHLFLNAPHCNSYASIAEDIATPLIPPLLHIFASNKGKLVRGSSYLVPSWFLSRHVIILNIIFFAHQTFSSSAIQVWSDLIEEFIQTFNSTTFMCFNSCHD